jgi:hypothetical protein
MEKRNRQKFSAEFKAKIILEPLKVPITVKKRVSWKLQVHLNMNHIWGNELVDNKLPFFIGENLLNKLSSGKRTIHVIS